MPFPNAECRVATHEAEVLEAMADTPYFPRNWRIEEASGRKWLVRKVVYVIGETYEVRWVTREQVLQVEQALRTLNSRYWTVNDPIKVAVDPDTDEVFLLDLSAAARQKNAAKWLQADDSWRFQEWAKQIGFTNLVQLRQAARHVVSSARWILQPGYKGHTWVYGSWHRPMSAGWPGKDIPDALYATADKSRTDMHSWVVVPAPLDEQIIARYQLQWCWGPIVYEE